MSIAGPQPMPMHAISNLEIRDKEIELKIEDVNDERNMPEEEKKKKKKRNMRERGGYQQEIR